MEHIEKQNIEKEKFPDIPAVPEGMLRASSQGRLVVFIGAGASKIIGCPLWDEFAQKVLRYLYENKCINFHEFENLCKLNSRKLLSICKQIISDKKPNPPPNFRGMLSSDEKLMEKYKIYENLYSWKAIYVTTNFDKCLDKIALERQPIEITLETLEGKTQSKIEPGISPKIISSKDELLVSNLSQGNVLHLHGSVEDESSLIITTSDYLKNYIVGSKATILLEEIFKSYTVLFVGYGLEEYEILEYLVSKTPPIKGTLQHYMLYPMFKEEGNLFEFQRKYYNELGIVLVPYPIGENGYEHLATVIKEWAKVIGPMSKPQGFLERIKLIDEVI